MVFLFICILIVNTIIIIYFSSIQVEINNFNFSSILEEHISNDYKVFINWRIFGKLPIKEWIITQSKLEKINIKEKMKNINLDKFKDSNIIYKKRIKVLKKLNIKIQELNLYIDIGTENSMLTALIIPILSTLISVIVSNKIKDSSNAKFVVSPVFINQNIINIIFSGIFELKIRNIIYIIYILIRKEGVRKYERTSNRRTYGYSYE